MVNTSLDLGISGHTLRLSKSGVLLPDGQSFTWEELEEVAASETACYAVGDGQIWKIQLFSEELNRLYSLMPTPRAPTMLISGIPMHRIKDTDPYQDTLSKIKALLPLTGRVLDTATGLGYTAIEAARTAEQVVTIELDPTVLEICRFNPWSAGLFTNPHIEQRIGDAFDETTRFEDEAFSNIIHDPPTMSLAGHLYSAEFYRGLHRILRPRGRLFHYIGDPKSRSGRNVTRGVSHRLREAGFRRVVPQPEAFGVVANK